MTVIATAPPRGPASMHVGRTVALRCLALTAVLVALAAVHVRRPATLCPFRAVTGIPCPFCGGTTAATRLGHTDLLGALAASPLAVLMLLTWPLVGVVRAPRWWHARVVRWAIIGGVLAFAEVWQLLRFGLMGV